MALKGTKADFSQRDSAWADILLGFSTWQKIRTFGCVIGSIANIGQAQGYDVTPADVNRMLKDKNQFVFDGYKPPQKSDLAGPGAVTKIFPKVQNIENKDWGKKILTRDDIKFFDIRKNATDDIMVKIDYHPETPGRQDHYCRVIGTNSSYTDVEVVDTYTGKRIWLSSLGASAGKLIYKAYKYRGPGTGFLANIPASPAPSMVGIRLNGSRTQHWNMRTSPEIGNNVRDDGHGEGGQMYSAEILPNGWARVLFKARTAYLAPKAFTRI